MYKKILYQKFDYYYIIIIINNNNIKFFFLYKKIDLIILLRYNIFKIFLIIYCDYFLFK